MKGQKHFSEKLLAYSFLTVAIMVIVMVFLGGLTRLTGSGLSIVEWDPFKGILPPLSHLDWENLFAKYRASPEFIKINNHMDVITFKNIFWLEYIHRVWGRLIGFILLIPTFLVLKNKILRQAFLPSVCMLWTLGAFQAFLGWYMVKSGLVDDPHVSPYRLTIHLGMAFLILWVALRAFTKASQADSPYQSDIFMDGKIIGSIRILIGFVLITALFGGLVAGHKAGLIYNTFPLMDGEWFPPGLWIYSSIWQNLLENPGIIQFIHRVFAVITFFLILCFGFYTYGRAIRFRLWGTIVSILGMIQVTLGIITLLYQVPVYLAAFHQLFAILLFSSLVLFYERLKVMNE